jgi:hypothetical protein
MRFCLTQEAAQFCLADHHPAKPPKNPEVPANSGSPERGIRTTTAACDVLKRVGALLNKKLYFTHIFTIFITTFIFRQCQLY